MQKKDFIVNNKVKIQLNDEEYLSNVQDVKDEYIGISIPVNNGSYVSLSVGSRVDVVYYEERCLYEFTTRVIGRRKDNIPIILLAYPENIKKVQRRRFVRINHLQDIKFLEIDSDVNNNLVQDFYDDKCNDVHKAILVDISGGGCRINTSYNINLNDDILIKMPIKKREMVIKCKVVRVDKGEDGSNICGIIFLNLCNREREAIIQYIFQIMREQRKKGIKES
ncbi:flagellar brake protein [Haloimpatiens sp. FM7330]|uniref:flagellar brake protein n=1 Tax=Haloimpatiens sp. FM7330 TaxID=3298610 RepID=UPI003630FED3